MTLKYYHRQPSQPVQCVVQQVIRIQPFYQPLLPTHSKQQKQEGEEEAWQYGLTITSLH
jgi:hypothetical protein